MREYIVIGMQIPRRAFLQLLMLYYAIYAGYYSFLATLNVLQTQYPMHPSLLLVFFSFTIAASLLVSGGLAGRHGTLSFIYAWAVLSPLLYIGYTVTTDPVIVTGLTIIAGALFGAAVWTLTRHFVNVTLISERGRVGSTITAFTLFTTPIIVVISMQYPLPVQVVLSLIALLTIAIKTPAPNLDTGPRRSQLTDLWRDKRAFLILFVPWALLCFNNATLMYTINSELSTRFADLQVTAFTLQYLSAGFGTLLCGLVIDWVGRRSMAILSYAMLGITTCVSGLVPTPSLYMLFHITSGIGWGSLLVLFLLIVWDEVAPPRAWGIKYGLGLSIYHVTQGIGVFLAPLPFQISEAALLNAILMFVSISVLYGGQNLIPVEVKERMFYDLYLYQAKKLVK